MNKKKIERNIGIGEQSFYVVSGKLIALIANLSIPLILIRIITKSDYGIYSQFNVIVLFLNNIFSFGIHTSLYYFLPKQSIHTKKTYVFQTYSMLFLFSIPAIALLHIPLFSNSFIGINGVVQYRTTMLICLFFSMPPLIIESLSIATKDVKTSLYYPPVQSLLRFFFLISVIILFSSNIQNLLKAYLFSILSTFIFSLFYVIRYLKMGPKQKLVSIDKIIKQLKYSIPYGAAVVLNSVVRQIDKIICISYLTTTDYAIYSVAFIGVPGIQQIYDSISQVFFTKIVEAVKEFSFKDVINLYNQLISKVLSYTIPVILIVAWFARDLVVFLFTPEYVNATPLFRLYLISFIFGMFGAGIILRATGNTKLTLKAYIISAIIVTPASFLLISRFAIWGAITTALLGSLLPKIIMIFFEIKIVRSCFKDYFPWKNIFFVSLISTLFMVPVAIFNQIFSKGILETCIISIVYLMIVFYIEIKLGLFVVDEEFIRYKYLNLKRRLHIEL